MVSARDIVDIVRSRTEHARLEARSARQRPELLDPLLAELRNDEIRHASVLTGPRRTGKTWLLQMAGLAIEPEAQFWFCDFTDQRLWGATMRDVIEALGVSGDSPPLPTRVFFDEVHYLKNWSVELAALVNERRARIAIADSAAAMMRQSLAQAAVGRVSVIEVGPLGFAEFVAFRGQRSAVERATATLLRQLVDTYLTLGGFPEASARSVADSWSAHRFLRQQVVQQAVEKDINHIVGLRQPIAMEHMVTALMARSGQLRQWSGLARLAGVSGPTVQKWFVPLVQSGLLWTLPRWERDPSNLESAAPKVYACDTGLVAACTPDSDHLRNRDLGGRLFETAVANALRRVVETDGGRLRYWRDKRAEADFVIDLPGGSAVVEVTAEPNASGKVANLSRVADIVGAGRRVVVCDSMSSNRVHGVDIVPLGRFLLAPQEFLS